MVTVCVSDHTVENGVLLIPVVREEDFGVYVCSARNKLGFVEATTELIPGGLIVSSFHSFMSRATVFPRKILPNSAAQCVKFREIPRHYYPQIPYIPRPVGVVVLTDNSSKCKELTVTCNTKTHYSRPLMSKRLLLLKKHSALSTQTILCPGP